MATNDNEFPIKIGENILCYHGLLIYRAKCTDLCHAVNGKPLFHVHYIGWKKSYDEWVDYDRILEINPDNMAKMAELQNLYSSAKKNKTKQKKRLQGKISKIMSNQNVTTSVSSSSSSKPNEILNRKTRGIHSRSKNTIKTFEIEPIVRIVPIVSSDIGNNKKQVDNLNGLNTEGKNRIKLKKSRTKQENKIEETNPQASSSKSRKLDLLVPIDSIDLTKDEAEIKEVKQLVFNIYIKEGITKQPVVHIHNVN